LRRANPLSKEYYQLCKKYFEIEEEARAKQRAVEPLMNEWIINKILREEHRLRVF
jgi:hypothetical protein